MRVFLLANSTKDNTRIAKRVEIDSYGFRYEDRLTLLLLAYFGHRIASSLPSDASLQLYAIPEHGGLQGMNRAITTYRLPLNHGIPSYPKVPVYLSTTPVYKETTYIPRDSNPMN